MNVPKINIINFKNDSDVAQPKKHEFIDRFTDSVRNPRDVNDCVAVPRGIFKAYLFIMSGSAILALSNLIPSKNKFGKISKISAITLGWVLNTLSALYFAKPFAIKGLSPTVKREDFGGKPS